jgi:hypothetical protein
MQKNINDDVISSLLSVVKAIEFLPIFQEGFWSDFLSRWTNGTQTTADIQLRYLMLQYITSCIEYRAVTTLSYQIRAAGVLSMNAENAVKVTDSERISLLNQLNSDKEFYKSQMLKFIQDNYYTHVNSKAYKNFQIL